MYSPNGKASLQRVPAPLLSLEFCKTPHTLDLGLGAKDRRPERTMCALDSAGGVVSGSVHRAQKAMCWKLVVGQPDISLR